MNAALAALLSLWESEPAAVIAVIDAAIVLAVTFGAPITDPQKAALDAVLVALGGLWTRSQVTPTAKLPKPPGG